MSQERYQLVERSSSPGKMYGLPVTNSHEGTCPPACPFKGSGCYGDNFHCRLNWDKINSGERGLSFAEYCEAMEKLRPGTQYRMNMVGDLPGSNDRLDHVKVALLVVANLGKDGATYTHYPILSDDVTGLWLPYRVEVAVHNRMVVDMCNHNGLTVNLSANNLSHADKLADQDVGPVCVVLPEDQLTNTRTPDGRKVVVCPAAYRKETKCSRCRLCWRRDRTFIVGLPAHGTKKKAASKIAEGE